MQIKMVVAQSFVTKVFFCIAELLLKACLEAGAKIEIDVFQQTRV
jgi:hypothetical protein